MSLIDRGMIPAFIDVGAAFTAHPPPLQQTAAPFHNYASQWGAQKQSVVTHGFSLANVKLDLSEELLHEETGERECVCDHEMGCDRMLVWPG